MGTADWLINFDRQVAKENEKCYTEKGRSEVLSRPLLE